MDTLWSADLAANAADTALTSKSRTTRRHQQSRHIRRTRAMRGLATALRWGPAELSRRNTASVPVYSFVNKSRRDTSNATDPNPSQCLHLPKGSRPFLQRRYERLTSLMRCPLYARSRHLL